jgi:hypothetical protein
MEISKAEVEALDRVTKVAADDQVSELDELQLALIGGGIGIVIVG